MNSGYGAGYGSCANVRDRLPLTDEGITFYSSLDACALSSLRQPWSPSLYCALLPMSIPPCRRGPFFCCRVVGQTGGGGRRGREKGKEGQEGCTRLRGMYAHRFAQRKLCSWLCDIGPCHVCWMRFAVFPQVLVSHVALILPLLDFCSVLPENTRMLEEPVPR